MRTWNKRPSLTTPGFNYSGIQRSMQSNSEQQRDRVEREAVSANTVETEQTNTNSKVGCLLALGGAVLVAVAPAALRELGVTMQFPYVSEQWNAIAQNISGVALLALLGAFSVIGKRCESRRDA